MENARRLYTYSRSHLQLAVFIYSDCYSDRTGTLNSPQLLMLSGVGPRDHLTSLGINVIEDLPVGFNLQDHVSTATLTFLVNDSVTFLQQREGFNPANYLAYLIHGTGPLTIPGGAEALAFINTKVSGPRTKQRKQSKLNYDSSLNTPESGERKGESIFWIDVVGYYKKS